MLFSKEEKEEDKELLNKAVIDLSSLLVDYGFEPEEAVKTAKDFWGKHKKKLKESLTLSLY